MDSTTNNSNRPTKNVGGGGAFEGGGGGVVSRNDPGVWARWARRGVYPPGAV